MKTLLILAILGLPAIYPAVSKKNEFRGLKIGIASYTFRKFPLEKTIGFTKKLGLRYINIKSFHLAMDSTKKERREASDLIREAGLVLLGGGVIKFKSGEDEIRHAFEYARDAGMPLIVISCEKSHLPMVEKYAIKFNIKAAIHNHGPTDKNFPSPLDAYRASLDYDKLIGVCMDVGHTARNGEDEVKVLYQVKDRLYDVHLKDVSARSKSGKSTIMGTGVVNMKGVLKALLDIKFQGHVGIEYEKNANAPFDDVKKSVNYLKKILKKL